MLENRDPSGGAAGSGPGGGVQPGRRAGTAGSRAFGSDPAMDALETAVLAVLNDDGMPMTIEDVQAALNLRWSRPPTYVAVATVLGRLTERGAVHRRPGHEDSYVTGAAAAASGGTTTEDTAGSFVDERAADPQLLHRLQRFLRDED